MNYCPKCGEKIKEGASFCPGCGEKITKTDLKKFEEKNPKTEKIIKNDTETKPKSNGLKVFLIIIFLVILIGAIVIFFGAKSSNSVRSSPDYMPQELEDSRNPLPIETQYPYETCEKYLSDSEKSDCMWDIAERIGDMDYCIERYEDEKMISVRQPNTNDCLDNMFKRGITTLKDCELYIGRLDKAENCMRLVIVNKGEEALCQLITNEDTRNRCYQDIAQDKKDMTICNNIEETEPKYECIDGVTQVTY